MDIKNKNNINKSVVRIFSEILAINPYIPFDNLPPKRSQGTGFFINNKGYILTCAHVVESSKNIIIDIPNISSEKYKCELIFLIPEFDLALLKTISYKNKNFLELGNSDELIIGEQVFAVGFPKSINRSGSNNIKYTLGIISGHQEGLIQTDTPINSGNSGGPLFKDEKVIGINSRKMVGSNVSNIGYSIPINYYKNSSLKKKEIIIYRPLLNSVINNTDKNICSLMSQNNSGVYISKIYENSIFKNIKKDFIITKFDGYLIDNYGYLDKRWLGEKINIKNILNFYPNNKKIDIEYYINNKKFKKKINLTPKKNVVDFMYSNYEKIDFLIIGGAVLMNLYLDHAAKLNLFMSNHDFYEKKVIVSYILPNSKLNILNNIVAGTIIKEINNKKINNLNDVRNAISKPLKIKNNKILKLKNDDGNVIFLNMDEIIKENKILSKLYHFNLKNIIH